VHWHIFNEYLKGKLKKMILGGDGLDPRWFDLKIVMKFSDQIIHWTIKKDICSYVPFRTFHDNSQVKPPPPKNTFLISSSKNSDLNQICLSLKALAYI
jgi:hypothetical protein